MMKQFSTKIYPYD